MTIHPSETEANEISHTLLEARNVLITLEESMAISMTK